MFLSNFTGILFFVPNKCFGGIAVRRVFEAT